MRKLLTLTLLIALGVGLLQSVAPKADDSAAQNSKAQEYLNRVSFFGDSTTYGLLRYIVRNDGSLGAHDLTLRADQILTPPSGTFYLCNLGVCTVAYHGREYPLSEGLRTAAPEILVVTVGLNGLNSWNEQSFKKYYSKLIDTISDAVPDAKLILQSVYPTSELVGTLSEKFTNDRIDRLNVWVSELAADYSVAYLDSASVLKDEYGRLPVDCQNGDGIHLNTKGFSIVLENICRNRVV